MPATLFVTPMSKDKKSYFSAMKKAGLTVKGTYKYQGKSYNCAERGQCLMMIDNGRTHNPYGNAYYWVLLMTKLADGRVVTINVGDGMGSKYDKVDQASEDFVFVDDKYYRLDVTRMISTDNRKFVNEKQFKTAQQTEYQKRTYPNNDCDLSFEPVIAGSD